MIQLQEQRFLQVKETHLRYKFLALSYDLACMLPLTFFENDITVQMQAWSTPISFIKIFKVVNVKRTEHLDLLKIRSYDNRGLRFRSQQSLQVKAYIQQSFHSSLEFRHKPQLSPTTNAVLSECADDPLEKLVITTFPECAHSKTWLLMLHFRVKWSHMPFWQRFPRGFMRNLFNRSLKKLATVSERNPQCSGVIFAEAKRMGKLSTV